MVMDFEIYFHEMSMNLLSLFLLRFSTAAMVRVLLGYFLTGITIWNILKCKGNTTR